MRVEVIVVVFMQRLQNVLLCIFFPIYIVAYALREPLNLVLELGFRDVIFEDDQ